MKKPKPNSLEMVSVKRLRWTATTKYNNEQVRRVAAWSQSVSSQDVAAHLDTGNPLAMKRMAQAKMIVEQAKQYEEDLKKSAEEAQ